MDFERLDRIAFEKIGKRKSHLEREIGACYYHGVRVAQGVVELRKKIFPNDSSHDEILRCAGLFHDVAKGIEPHPGYGAIIVRELLKNVLTEEELVAVADLIAVHDDRAPESDLHDKWIRLLQDADLLDHYGVQGVWLSFTYQAYTGQQQMMPLIDFYDGEWTESIAKSRQKLNYDISKEIFDEKAAFEYSVIERMKREGKGFYV